MHFNIYAGHQVSTAQLAQEACEIEIERCGKPIGKQDQYIAAYGRVHAFRFACDGSVQATRLSLSDSDLRRLSSNLFLFYSDQTRKADNILSQQKERTGVNLEFLDGIKDLASEGVEALNTGDFERIGTLLNKNWELKKKLADKITNPRLDEMYNRAIEAGAIGGKISGAGGGGFLLTYCPAASRDRLLRNMADYRWMPFSIEPDGSKVIFNYRRPSWK